MAQVSALWACCGVEFVVQPTNSFAVNLTAVNMMKPTVVELNAVYAQAWTADTINVYIVEEIGSNFFGLGLSRATVTSIAGLTHPGAFMGMRSGTTNRSNDTYYCANDLAHELGHFFTLRHPTDETPSGAVWSV